MKSENPNVNPDFDPSQFAKWLNDYRKSWKGNHKAEMALNDVIGQFRKRAFILEQEKESVKYSQTKNRRLK